MRCEGENSLKYRLTEMRKCILLSLAKPAYREIDKLSVDELKPYNEGGWTFLYRCRRQWERF